MKLVRLIYASRFSKKFSYNDFQTIMETSRENNPRKAITGALCYAPGLFLQCLEGPRESVNELYVHITSDDRHSDVTLLNYAEIEERVFAKWSMAYVRADEISADTILRFSATAKFDPYAMSSGQALAFMRSLIAQKDAFLEADLRQKNSVQGKK